MGLLGRSEILIGTGARRKLIGYVKVGLLVSFVFTIYLHFRSNVWEIPAVITKTSSESEPFTIEPITDSSLLHRKWIVVTSIFPPTDQIQKLSKIPGWQLLVVADLKTPLNWTLPNAILIDVNQQKNLGYSILKFLPWNSYTRKVIGYLFAIQHGAKYIYDTDDDNAPNEPSSLENNFVLKNVTRGLVSGRNPFVANPYAHFGQRTVWPRGYPLDQISQPHNMTYTSCSMRTPIIQQGLVNGDPDVDAIFRLTRRFMRPNIEFDSHAPPMIFPSSVLAPFNSQNTMFHYEAFWSMLLPISVAFRVTDIWRGYWVQPLLWMIGGHLGFYPPYTTQVRNSHVYLKDFGEEDQLYKQSGDLARFLSTWKCNNTSLFKCMVDLTEAMTRDKYWGPSESDLMHAWISDLKAIGYKEPPFKPMQPPCLNNEVESTAFFTGVDLALPQDSQRSALRQFCNFTAKKISPSPKFNTELLVITFNFPHYENIWLLDLIYRPHYPNILYCGEMKNFSVLSNLLNSKAFVDAGVQNVSFVSTVNIHQGHFLYECALRAIDMGYSVSGYLVVSDDILLNFWNNMDLNPGEMWVQNNIKYRNMQIPLESQPSVSNYYFWRTETTPTLKVMSELQNSTNPIVQEFWKRKEAFGVNSSLIGIAMSDMFYLPAGKQEMFYVVGTILWKAKIFLEFATPLLSDGISGPNNTIHLNGTSVWDGERAVPFKAFNSSHSFLHPVKFSQARSNAGLRLDYCQHYVARVLGISR